MFKEIFLESKPVLDKEAKKILKWLDDFLDLNEAIKQIQGLKQGTFKEILAHELSQFKSIKKFYDKDNKIYIDGTHNDGSKVIKKVPFPTNDYQHKKDLLKALNVRMKPKINKGK